MKIAEFLQKRAAETKEITVMVKSEFLPLSEERLSRKPSEDKWSIRACFQHLNLTLEVYVSQMLDVIKDPDKYPQTEDEFTLGFMGRMGVRAMQPKEGEKISYKMKTFKVLDPERSNPGDNAVGVFLDHQEDLLRVIDGLEHMSLSKPKITTVIGPLFKMSIGDALHFMIAHNQRHILQARKVLQIIQ